jgi:uncharacterized protein involved in exopolysaccharide biosynthesis
LRTTESAPGGARTLAGSTVGATPRIGVGQAALRHWGIVLGTLVVTVGIAVAVGLTRTPTYTSESRLEVGRVDVRTPDLGGFVVATQSLASAYARAVRAQGVVEPIARDLGVSDDEVKSRLTATPIAESPVFRIEAEGESEAEAVELANLATQEIIQFTTRLNRENPDSERLFADYRRATLRERQLERVRGRAAAAFRQNPSPATRDALDRAEADLAAAQLQVRALSQSYQESQEGQANTSLLQVLTPAADASSDKTSKLQLLIAIGLFVGLFLGLALATLRANSSRPRFQAG